MSHKPVGDRHPKSFRNPERPRCGYCRHPGFDIVGYSTCKADKRPEFRCQKCGRTWTCGSDGEPYTSYAKSIIPRAEETEW